jgi:hypothetical protein
MIKRIILISILIILLVGCVRVLDDIPTPTYWDIPTVTMVPTWTPHKLNIPTSTIPRPTIGTVGTPKTGSYPAPVTSTPVPYVPPPTKTLIPTNTIEVYPIPYP